VGLNSGILTTPFHNMALLSAEHTVASVVHHTQVFASALATLTQ